MSNELGVEAERWTESWLQSRGLVPLERNFRCRRGELDLVMRHNEDLVFIEVRHRRNPHFGTAAESVTPAKQRKLISAAQFYLFKNPALARYPCRFDVVEINGDSPSEETARWHRHAFGVTS